jgi:hypothetical protein
MFEGYGLLMHVQYIRYIHVLQVALTTCAYACTSINSLHVHVLHMYAVLNLTSCGGDLLILTGFHLGISSRGKLMAVRPWQGGGCGKGMYPLLRRV